ncbi:hypothetical protein J437_LFUL001688 [Ladona fulva]|uniref:NudC domain-containing protein 1 n=1 Tax=Ladona fulva TaxID=123851 RepID=A0A8K0K3Y4_LADFU|nr:hypothetical protein J437_LFUL001688 [Ladona fulva]
MENATLVELRPSGDLLDPNFSSYKLSLDPIPMHETTLPAKVDHLLRSEEQFSLQHVKLFGLHNHLLYDPWNLDDVYYVDKDKTVKRNVVDKETGKLSGVSKVWNIPSTHERRAGHYSPSGYFPAKDLVLLSDGAGTLHLIHSGERVKPDKAESQWKVLFTNEVCGEEVPYVVVHARDIAEEKDESANVIEGRKVHCLLLHVEEAKKVKGQKDLPQIKEKGTKSSHTSFVSVLEWIILEEDYCSFWAAQNFCLVNKDGAWSVGRRRKLCGFAIPEYAAVCEDGISLTISSEEPFIFITDTGKPLKDEIPEKKEDTEKDGEPAEKRKPVDDTSARIEWMENLDEVRLSLPLEGSSQALNPYSNFVCYIYLL